MRVLFGLSHETHNEDPMETCQEGLTVRERSRIMPNIAVQ